MHRETSAIFNDWQDLGLITAHHGPDQTVTGIAPVETCGPGDLVFVDKPAFTPAVAANKPACVVTNAKLADEFADQEDLAVLVAPNVTLAQALMRQKYVDREFRGEEWPTVHASAVIHETAQLGEGTVVGPGVVIGANVTTGRECVIMAGSVIEHGASLGNRTIIHPNVTVGYDCELGNEVMVHSGSVIGSEGYGFAQDDKGRSHRIPQLGKVVIEDRVRVGACNCIDRAAFAETRIGAGTKFDNLCHVAHNVTIGQDCLLLAGLIVAGSSKLGNRVIASGATGVLDHLSVCDDAVLVHRAGVAKDITEPGVYAGGPTQPLAEYLRNQSAARKGNEMLKRLRALEAKVMELEKKE